jgi:chaperonin GroEL (HSP60 family)
MAHSKNVQAFEKLLGVCTGLGGTYKPGKQNLRVSVMHSMLVQAQQALSEVREAKTLYNQATNHRENLFKATDKLASSMYHVLQASGANQLTIEDARRALNRLLNGVRSAGEKEKASVELPASKKWTGFGRDYTARIQHFAQLVDIVSKDADYTPEEQELQVEALLQRVEALQAANTWVLQASLTLAKARSKRNEVLYVAKWSLYKTVRAVKAYVKAIFGATSSTYQLLVAARFTKPSA